MSESSGIEPPENDDSPGDRPADHESYSELEEAGSTGRRIRHAARDILGWVLTAIGVIALIVLIGGGETTGWLTDATRTIVTVGVGIGSLASVAVGVAFVAVRARNRRIDRVEGQASVTPRARASQQMLASLLERVSPADDNRFRMPDDLRRDRSRLTAHTLGRFDHRADAFDFIRAVRASQPDGFPSSPEFAELPSWARDAIVLFDLDTDLRLHGAQVALSAAPGFYRHPLERIVEACERTGEQTLIEIVRAARSAIGDDDRPSGGQRPEHENLTRHLLDCLDGEEIWARLLSAE